MENFKQNYNLKDVCTNYVASKLVTPTSQLYVIR